MFPQALLHGSAHRTFHVDPALLVPAALLYFLVTWYVYTRYASRE